MNGLAFAEWPQTVSEICQALGSKKILYQSSHCLGGFDRCGLGEQTDIVNRSNVQNKAIRE
jgi:hypothetical protein